MKKVILILLVILSVNSNAIGKNLPLMTSETIKTIKMGEFELRKNFSLYKKEELFTQSNYLKPLSIDNIAEYNFSSMPQKILIYFGNKTFEFDDKILYIIDEKDKYINTYRPSCHNWPEMFFVSNNQLFYWCEYQCKQEGVVEKINISNNNSTLILYKQNCSKLDVLKHFKAVEINLISSTIEKE